VYRSCHNLLLDKRLIFILFVYVLIGDTAILRPKYAFNQGPAAGEDSVVSPKTMDVKEYVAHADAQTETERETRESVVSQKTISVFNVL
jgi:hypothetical protein